MVLYLYPGVSLISWNNRKGWLVVWTTPLTQGTVTKIKTSPMSRIRFRNLVLQFIDYRLFTRYIVFTNPLKLDDVTLEFKDILRERDCIENSDLIKYPEMNYEYLFC